MHYGRRLIHFQENILWHWIQMIYLFTLQRQFFLCCVYTHIDLDWPGFSCFIFITIAKQSFSFMISCRSSRRIITECRIKLKIDRFQNILCKLIKNWTPQKPDIVLWWRSGSYDWSYSQTNTMWITPFFHLLSRQKFLTSNLLIRIENLRKHVYIKIGAMLYILPGDQIYWY